MYNKEKAAAITLCRQLEDPIKNAVIDNPSIPIINAMRGSYILLAKPTFVAKVLLEIGNRLEENPSTGFSTVAEKGQFTPYEILKSAMEFRIGSPL